MKIDSSKIIAELRKLKNPEKAKVLSGFFKTGKGEYGEGDKFLGVVVPLQRKIVKEYFQSLTLSEAEKLLASPFHEERLTALLILVKKFEKGNEKEQKAIFYLYIKNSKRINNWDLVDLSTPNIVGNFLLDRDRKILYKLILSKNLWERRIAILATFAFIKNGEYKDAFQICEKILEDREDLIHKASGWMLREVGKRCGEEIEEKFLKKHYKNMPRTMLRYAIERFPEKKRKNYLLGKV